MIQNWRLTLCCFYLLLQVSLIVSARFSSNKYFIWAPHDIQTEYFLEVYKKGQQLNDFHLSNRYGLKKHGWIDLPAAYLIKFFTEYERFTPDSETDWVVLKYSVNGHKWKKWNWKRSN